MGQENQLRHNATRNINQLIQARVCVCVCLYEEREQERRKRRDGKADSRVEGGYEMGG